MKNKYQQMVGKLNYWLFLVVVFLLPFPQIFLRYACVIWVIFWFLEGRWVKRPKKLKENKIAIPFIMFGIWYLWKILSYLWAADHQAWAWQIERYLTFGMLVPISIWGLNDNYRWHQIGKIFVISCISAIFIYLIIFTIFFHNRTFVETLNIHPKWDFSPTTWFDYIDKNLSFIKHRLFLCSVELFGIIVAFQLYSKNLKVIIPSSIIMLLAIPLTGSRQSILTCVGIAVTIVIFALPKTYRLRYGVLILLLGMILGGGLLMLHPRMQEFNFSALTEIRNIHYTHDIRLNIWGIALQSPQDYLEHGLGAGQSSNYMMQQYKNRNLSFFLARGYHSHNQYLEELIEIGISGMIFFIIAWLSIAIFSHHLSRKTATLFTIIFMMNMLTDCMFGRFCGIALWAFAMLYTYLQYHNENELK